MSQSLALLRNNFLVYAPVALRIRTKGGTVVPFQLNAAQRYIHAKLEEQRAKLGRVRALILKGRQQGCSTYIEARYYWRASGQRGVNAYILTHLQEATDNLFGMVQRYHDNCPPELKPSTKNNNAKELIFDQLDSGYKLATAGTKGAGRSATAQLFHGSEVAFWPNAEDHMAGIGQIVSDADGTEMILETTANGIGNLFHDMWQRAEAGTSDYIPIFVPWFWQTEYRRQPPPDWTPTDEEEQYRADHGLSIEALYWRHRKIADDFNGDELYFRQEYPATSQEAFVSVGTESYIKAHDVLAARKTDRPPIERRGARVLGVDPARFGKDSTALVRRQGRVAYGLQKFTKLDTMEVAGRVAVILADKNEGIDHCFIDVGGLGAGVVDRLNELGFGDRVTGVNFGGKAIAEDRYFNKRSEMWGELKDWLANGPVQIPDDNALNSDLVGPQYGYDSNGRLKLESKDDMLRRRVRSPDNGDALALTFAEPVAAFEKDTSDWRERLREMSRSRGNGRTWMSR